MDACLLHETTCAVACLRNQGGSGRGHMLLINADTCTWCTLGNGHDRSKVMNRFGGILCNNPCLIGFFFHFHPHPTQSLINSLRTNNFTAIDCEYKKASF